MSLLPLVNPEVGHSIAADLNGASDKQLVIKEIKRIQKENPAIADFIGHWSKQMKGEAAIHAAFCGILVYKLLHSQAEVDQMVEDIKLS